MSGSAANVIVWPALFTVNELLPELKANEASPAKFAPTPVGYVPPLMPLRLTLESVATPLAFVVAVLFTNPEPFKLKLTVLPFTPAPPV